MSRGEEVLLHQVHLLDQGLIDSAGRVAREKDVILVPELVLN